MVQEEQIIMDYQNNRRQLESDEELLHNFKKRGEQALEQAYQNLDMKLRNDKLDHQAVSYLKQELIKVQNSYDEIINHEQKSLLKKLENNELNYQEKLNQNK